MTSPSRGGGLVTLPMTDGYKTQTRQQVLEQSIEVVRRRIDEMGTREPTIERSGDDRILVQVPGLQDPAQLKTILGKTAKMTFQLVDETADPNAERRARWRRNPAAAERNQSRADRSRWWCSAG